MLWLAILGLGAAAVVALGGDDKPPARAPQRVGGPPPDGDEIDPPDAQPQGPSNGKPTTWTVGSEFVETIAAGDPVPGWVQAGGVAADNWKPNGRAVEVHVRVWVDAPTLEPPQSSHREAKWTFAALAGTMPAVRRATWGTEVLRGIELRPLPSGGARLFLKLHWPTSIHALKRWDVRVALTYRFPNVSKGKA